jgi:NACHT domain-containing protein/pentapeptide repeat protein
MLVTSILQQIRKDVASFADPGTEVQITDRSLTWMRSRVPLTVQLVRRASGFPDVLADGRQYTYTSFLASELLADLKDLAATIAATAVPPSHYVPVYGRCQMAPDSPATVDEASELILKNTVDPASLPLAATRVLFVHGNAGTGKTSTLLYVARRQAERYLEGQASTLLLYLDAQGKGLSQLEDVMARALQDLRAKFTYHSIAALTRRQCVIPIVDGFDELIGPSSAREAFSNLAQFLAQLECEGALIASSRSAFIDYRTLYERAAELAASQSLSYEIVPVEVLRWNDDAVRKYCEERTPGSLELKSKILTLMASPVGDLVRKPFFLTKICDIFDEGGTIDVHEDVPRQVVNAALAREAAKLRDQRGRELLNVEQHRAFCELLADEMWSLGTPELDCETVRLFAEVIAEQIRLAPRDAKTLVDRSIAHGLLTVVPGRLPEKRAFEHELFRFEFQAGGLARALKGGSDSSRNYVQRAELPLEVLSRISFYSLSEREPIEAVITDLSRIVAAAPNNQFAATNAGSILWALLANREDAPAGLKLYGFYLRSHDLGTCRLVGAEIRRCIFENVNLRSTRLEACRIEDSQFIACTMGEGTRWDGTSVDVVQFPGVITTNGRETYDPKEIKRILQAAGAVLPPEVGAVEVQMSSPAQARVALIERLLAHARTHFYISRQESWFQRNLYSDPAWEKVEPLLRKHRLIEEVPLTKSGRPEKFLRLTIAPDKILQAWIGGQTAPTAAARFWEDVLAD